jgi:hypothetical protein
MKVFSAKLQKEEKKKNAKVGQIPTIVDISSDVNYATLKLGILQHPT